ncbi:AI-2E family transporter [Agromyces soli]
MRWWWQHDDKARKRSGAVGATPVADAAAAQAAEAQAIAAVPQHRNAFLLLALGGGAVAAMGLAGIAGVFAPAFLALVLTICVNPVRHKLESRGVSRGLATGAVVVVVMLLLAGFFGALVLAVAQFATLLPEYATQMQTWLDSVSEWLKNLGIGQEQINTIISGFDPSKLAGVISSILGGATGFISWLVILLTMLVLMVLDAADAPGIAGLIGKRRPLVLSAAQRYTHGVRRYMVVTTALGAAQGLINWLALALLNVPGAALWGLLSFLCSFIPNIGYFIALVPPLVFGALEGGWPTVIGVIIVYGVINAVIQSFIQPRVVGNAVALNQSLTFFSVLFWAVILGPIGAILAIPLTLLVRALLVDSNPASNWVKPALGEVGELHPEKKRKA